MGWRKEELGLKSPVIIAGTLGCLENIASKFFWMWCFKINFHFAGYEVYNTQYITLSMIDVICLGSLWGLINNRIDSTSSCMQEFISLHGNFLSK